MKKFNLDVNFTGIKKEGDSFELPLRQYREVPRGFVMGKEYSEKIDSEIMDSYSDSLSINTKDKILWINIKTIREDFEEYEKEIEKWLRQFFLVQQTYAIKGFIRKQLQG